MTSCKYPEHHKSGGRSVLPFAIVVAAVVVAVVVAKVVAFIETYWPVAAGAAAVVVGLAVVVAAVRFVRLDRPARRYWVSARWHRAGWRRLARNLRLAGEDRHRGGIDSRRRRSVNYPRAHFRPDPYGFRVNLKLIHGVGRDEFEKNADHLANAWRCHRVGITQPRPGRLVVRAVRRDPLAEPLPSTVLPSFDGRRLLLGRDEFGQLRFARLDTISGSVIGGLPGRGKSVLAASFAVQLASPVVRSYIADGGGGADWSPWSDRAAAYADDLPGGVGVLEVAHQEMTKRLGSVAEVTGHRNAWIVGPSAVWPLCWCLLDESHVFFDVESAKAMGKQAELHVRSCRMLAGEMLRRGRKVMFHTTLIAQKPTSSSIPPDLRDLAGLRLSFAASTTEMSVASLGDDIRNYPTLNPTTLQGDEYIGVAVARLATGSDLFTRLRVPFISEDQADEVARQIRPMGRICVGCAGDGTDPAGGVCLRCRGSAVDPDPAAPTGIPVAS
jgi:S-DNA-T family DNA segregation ATPase FtsK/SpoIIIE